MPSSLCCFLAVFAQIKKPKFLKIMKLYLVQATSQKGNSYKRVILKATNDLNGEEIYFSGFYEEFDQPKQAHAAILCSLQTDLPARLEVFCTRGSVLLNDFIKPEELQVQRGSRRDVEPSNGRVSIFRCGKEDSNDRTRRHGFVHGHGVLPPVVIVPATSHRCRFWTIRRPVPGPSRSAKQW